MSDIRSKKHHYLPRHYLKGFTNLDGSFFVYDKQTKKIFASNPDNSFSENNLNTVRIHGQDSDFIEKMYSQIEGKVWSALDNIRDSEHKDKVEDLDKMNLCLFLATLHWRLPQNTPNVEFLSKRFFSDDANFKHFTLNSGTSKSVPAQIVDAIRNSDGFKKSARLLIPFTIFQDENWSESIANWAFSYPGDGKQWHMIGDNPLITEGFNDGDPKKFLDRFIFPVSGRVMLINNGTRLTLKELPEAFLLQFNTALVHKAERFVACPRKDLLEAVVKFYDHYVSQNMTHLIIRDLFLYLEESDSNN